MVLYVSTLSEDQWYMTIYTGVTQRSAPITRWLVGIHHKSSKTKSAHVMSLSINTFARWQIVTDCVIFTPIVVQIRVHYHVYGLYLYTILLYISCTWTWKSQLFTIVEARGTRSCIRVYGSGALDIAITVFSHDSLNTECMEKLIWNLVGNDFTHILSLSLQMFMK